MCAISDTTALICLAKSSKLSLLNSLGDTIIMAQSVINELEQKKDGLANMIYDSPMFTVQSAKNQKLFEELSLFLDSGESESIAIAKNMNIPLLIDEKKGRGIAKDMGVDIIGTVGLIVLAYKKGRIEKSEAVSIYDELKSVGFRASDELKEWFMGALC